MTVRITKIEKGMKRNIMIVASMLCVLTAIAGGKRLFCNNTNAVVNNEADYENVCMALDCLDSELAIAMEENEELAFANVDKEISTLRKMAEAANANGNLNRDEIFSAMDNIQNMMK